MQSSFVLNPKLYTIVFLCIEVEMETCQISKTLKISEVQKEIMGIAFTKDKKCEVLLADTSSFNENDTSERKKRFVTYLPE